MNSQLLDQNNFSSLSQVLAASRKRWMLRVFWVFLIAVIFIIINSNAPFNSVLGALLIAISALLPSYFWCSGRAPGLPLFPLLAWSYLWTHGLPLIANDPKVSLYSDAHHLNAALIVATFLVAGTITWLSFVKRGPQISLRLKVFKPNQVYPFFIWILFFCILYHLTLSAGYLWLWFPNSVVSLIRVAIPAINSLGLVILGYQLGAKEIKGSKAYTFIFLVILLIFVSGGSIYLNIPGVYLLLASFGWLFGSGRIPWRFLLISFLIVAFLNLGKGATRAIYWKAPIQPWQYSTLYTDWINNSLQKINSPSDLFASDQSGSLTDRASVIEMLLKVTSETGTQRPYLLGKTYAIIPELLLPRFLNPNKIRGAEANHMLSVYYGLQTYKQTFTTAIGWGLLQEAYANFGWFGSIGLGIFLGWIYGWITRWSMIAPASSYRFLIALIFLVLAIRTEITLGTFITVAFQSFGLLFVIRNLLMVSVATVDSK